MGKKRTMHLVESKFTVEEVCDVIVLTVFLAAPPPASDLSVIQPVKGFLPPVLPPDSGHSSSLIYRVEPLPFW